MSQFIDVSVGDLFVGRNGRPVFIKDYLDRHPGDFPVYSASLLRPFGHVETFDYDGSYLTWVMNGYGGRIQEIFGKFSANRDRGVLVPRDGIKVPDMTYLRYAMEPVFVAAAVGRRVEGRRNNYTKLYPDEAIAQHILVPIKGQSDIFDYARMEAIGSKLRRIESAQAAVRRALEDVLAARVMIDSLLSREESP